MHEIQYYLGLGSNIEPEKNLPSSVGLLRRHVTFYAFSAVWETPSIGEAGPNFLNAVIRIGSDLQPEELKYQVLRPVEVQQGRVRTSDKYAPRPIDIDILVVDGSVYTEDVWSFAHWAVPLAELLPNLTHPKSGKSLASVAELLRSFTKIRPRPDISLAMQLKT
ncbi:MAG TPA: 2-amino-4-hydroxy-6-hydroxymethyldihydropteridine diphosphokinase [Anaerolineales bacterium]|nr:2-amino-4-hydroxy-6-hydroxymethyldihydropteridine diphosphokinase [Anaerolineales bacterium]